MNKNAKARMEEIARIAREEVNNDGRYGKMFEIECRSINSRKVKVAKQGETDVFVKVGKGTVKAEAKTNGGRVESLYSAKAPKFVIYKMDYNLKHPACKSKGEWYERRTTEPLLIPTELFLRKLSEFGALKSTNGKNPETAIQVSNKKFYEWLCDYPVIYDNKHRFELWEFDGLD